MGRGGLGDASMERSPLAADPARSRGREFPGTSDETRGPRSAFQRDRDRIIHSIAFRRLRSKTQVFVAPEGDHYRTRLTHSLEVAQIGRVIARALGLDEDLTEALCLAHDIGHPPFGHAGEEALDRALVDHGGFDHNAQTLRTLMRLESPYCTHEGLNLSWEVLEGLAKHNGPVHAPHWALAELVTAFPLELEGWPTLEAQVAAVADDIAYDNHDIDDGLRAGFLELDDLLTLDFIADQWREVERRFPNAPRDRQLRELVRGQIGWMVNDVLAQTRAATGGMDDPAAIAGAADKANAVIERLWQTYCEDPARMGTRWFESLPAQEPHRSRHIADYIAGMSDRFALERVREFHGDAVSDLSNV